jgi:hypothetical protein
MGEAIWSAERTRDCVFTGDTLVLVGGSSGVVAL